MDVAAQNSLPKTDERNMSMGEQLNTMSGIRTEKNLFDEKEKMGKDTFLKMFMEQLKNQDPLNPVNNEQFSQQMAMFSQLEQQITTNKSLDKLVAAQSNTQIASLQLVGKSISADSGAIYHEKGKFSGINYKLPTDLSEVKLEVVDANGLPVKAYKLGPRNSGDQKWRWDGLLENGMPADSGRYSYKISGKGLDGKDVAINTKIDGRVTGVTSAHGVTFLLVGDQKINLNDVETIKEDTGDGKSTGSAKTGGGNMPVADGLAAFAAAQAEKSAREGKSDDDGAEKSDAVAAKTESSAAKSDETVTNAKSTAGTESVTDKQESAKSDEAAKTATASSDGSLFNEATLNGLLPLSLR